MKKLLIATMMLFAFTITFAQTNESTFKKNEISIAPYTANFIYYNSTPSNSWVKGGNTFHLLESDYRRYLNENTALRFGGRVYHDSSAGIGLNVRVGFEKYLPITSKFKIYGGAQMSLRKSGLFNTGFSSYAVGAGLIGGVRYNINDRWSINSEVTNYLWFSSMSDSQVWGTNVKWQPLKLNFRF